MTKEEFIKYILEAECAWITGVDCPCCGKSLIVRIEVEEKEMEMTVEAVGEEE